MEEVVHGTVSEDLQQGQYIVFHLDEECYAIETRYVMEIVGLFPITRMPEMHAHMKGIINLRGKIVPVMDMRLRIGKQELPYHERTCIIVTNVDEQDTGLIVDQVAEVLTIAAEQVAPPPTFATDEGNPFVRGIVPLEDCMLQLLDARRLLCG